MNNEEREQEIMYNKLNLLCLASIVLFEEMEEEGLIFHKQKQIGKKFIKELQKISAVICDVGKKTDEKVYREALNDSHISLIKLDNFINKMYNDN